MTAPAPTVVRSSDPRDLYLYAEHGLGFHPTDSVVAVSLRGERLRAGVVMRMDLADVVGESGPDGVAAYLARDDARHVVIFVVSDATASHHRLAARLRRAVLAAGAEHAETWLVRHRRLFSYTCRKACCPATGLPVADRAASPMAAELVAAGSLVQADRAAWEATQHALIAPADAATRASVAAAARRADAATDTDTDTDTRAVLDGWAVRLEAAVRAAGEHPGADAASAACDPEWTGALLATLSDHDARDALLASSCPDVAADWADAHRAGVQPAGVHRAGERADAQRAQCDPDRLDAALALLRAVVSRAGAGRRAEPLACLAWLMWHRGAGTAAGLHADLALAEDAAHTLAALVRQAVTYGIPCPRSAPASGSGATA